MKRTFIKGILSAAVVAACLGARGASQVYSQNVCDVQFSTTTNSLSYWPSISEDVCGIVGSNTIYTSSTVWQKGPFTFGESRTWPNYEFENGRPVGNPAQNSTWFTFGAHSFTVPLSPRQAAGVGGIGFGLVILFLIVGGLLMKRGRLAHEN